MESCFGLLGNQTCVNSVALQILALVVLGLSVSFSFFLCLASSLGGGGYRHDDCFDDFDSTRMTMRILGSFCSLLFFDVQVLGKKKLLPCQVGGEFLFALVARPVHLHHARPQGPSGRSFFLSFCDFPLFSVSRKPGMCLVSGFFLRPSGCFSVRGSGVLGFVLGRFWRVFRGVFLFSRRFWGWRFPCCLALSCISSCVGQRASAGDAGRNGARPPTRCELGRAESPVSCWESSSVRPGSRRVGGAGAIVTPSKPRFSTIAITIVCPGARSPPP